MDAIKEGLKEYSKLIKKIFSFLSFFNNHKFIEFTYQLTFYSLAISLIIVGLNHNNLDYNRIFIILLFQISLKLSYLTYNFKKTL